MNRRWNACVCGWVWELCSPGTRVGSFLGVTGTGGAQRAEGQPGLLGCGVVPSPDCVISLIKMAFLSLPGSSASKCSRGLGAFGRVGIGQQPFAFPEELYVCAGRSRGGCQIVRFHLTLP